MKPKCEDKMLSRVKIKFGLSKVKESKQTNKQTKKVSVNKELLEEKSSGNKQMHTLSL